MELTTIDFDAIPEQTIEDNQRGVHTITDRDSISHLLTGGLAAHVLGRPVTVKVLHPEVGTVASILGLTSETVYVTLQPNIPLSQLQQLASFFGEYRVEDLLARGETVLHSTDHEGHTSVSVVELGFYTELLQPSNFFHASDALKALSITEQERAQLDAIWMKARSN